MLLDRRVVLTGWSSWVRRRDPITRSARGQGIVEYGLILSLMVVVAAVILVVFGGTLAEVLSVIGSAIDGPG